MQLYIGLGLASLANQLGYKIDESLYRRASFQFMKDKLPWSKQNDIEYLKQRYADNDAVQYYCGAEARDAITKASKLRNKYFSQFPGIKVFLDRVKQSCNEYGYVKTWGKRRRHFKNSKKDSYKAPNALIQGSCGDILKVKLAELEDFLQDKDTKIINTVHDSILFEVSIPEYKAGIIDDLLKILRDLPFRVPMDWDVDASDKSWADIKSLEELNI